MVVKMSRIAVLVGAVPALASCATPTTKLQNASGQVVTCSAQGYGVMGATSAVLMHQGCVDKMEAEGYRAVGTENVAPPATKKADSALQLPLPAGWAEKPLSSAQAAGGGQIHAGNPTIDAGLLVSQVSKASITDFASYASARRAATASRLKNSSWSDLQEININGRKAWRFWVKGEAGGIALQFHGTVLEGSETVVLVNAWTSAANFETQKSALDSLAELISGI